MKHWPDRRSGGQPLTPMKMARAGLCVGCGACAERMHWDKNGFLKPRTDVPVPESFAVQCPFSPEAPNEDAIAAERFGEAPHADRRIGRFEAAYVGHAAE